MVPGAGKLWLQDERPQCTAGFFVRTMSVASRLLQRPPPLPLHPEHQGEAHANWGMRSMMMLADNGESAGRSLPSRFAGRA